MRVLISDNELYVFSFKRALEKQGGELMFTNYSRALDLFRSGTFDDVIVDVSKTSPNDTVGPYLAIREIVASPWIGTHVLTVYTHMPRRRFEISIHEMDIPSKNIVFCRKGGYDVPPCLECISAAIRSDPSLIGIDAIGQRPRKAITRRWIEAQEHGLYRAILQTVSSWAAGCAERNNADDVIRALPLGVRRAWLIGHMEDEVFNGGFAHFVGNLADEDEKVDASPYIDALTAFGIEDGADLVMAAVKLWLPAHKENQTPGVGCGLRTASEAADSYEAKLLELDRRFFELRDSNFASRIDAYIRQHPREFVSRKT